MPTGSSANSARRVKIAYLVSHPIQYQAPLLRRIAREPRHRPYRLLRLRLLDSRLLGQGLWRGRCPVGYPSSRWLQIRVPPRPPRQLHCRPIRPHQSRHLRPSGRPAKRRPVRPSLGSRLRQRQRPERHPGRQRARHSCPPSARSQLSSTGPAAPLNSSPRRSSFPSFAILSLASCPSEH